MLAGPASRPARRCRPRAVVAPGAARRPRPPRGPGAGSVLRHTSRPGPSRVRCVRLGPSRARSGHLRHMSSRARAGGTCPAATRAPGQLPAATRTATSPEGDRPGGRTLRPPWPGRAPPARRPGRSELGVLQFCVQRDERARDEVPRSPSVPPPKAHHPRGHCHPNDTSPELDVRRAMWWAHRQKRAPSRLPDRRSDPSDVTHRTHHSVYESNTRRGRLTTGASREHRSGP